MPFPETCERNVGRILQMGFFCRIRIIFGIVNFLGDPEQWEAAWQHGMHGLVQKALSPQLAFPYLTTILVRRIMISRSVLHFAASGTGSCIARCSQQCVR